MLRRKLQGWMENFTRTFAQRPFNGTLPKGRFNVWNLPIGYWDLDFTPTKFLDEFGVYVWTPRSKGRVTMRQRAVHIIEGQTRQNLTICLVVSSQIGLVHHTSERSDDLPTLVNLLLNFSRLPTYYYEPYDIL